MTVYQRPSGRRRLIIAGSVAAHAAALAAFVISGMWRIEKLDAAPMANEINVSMVSDAALAGGSPQAKDQAFKPKPKTEIVKRKIEQLAQPVKVEAAPPQTTPTSDDDTTGGGGGPPSDRVGAGGKCDNPPCGIDRHALPAPVPALPPPAPPKVTVTEQTLSALRLAGETMIHPPQPDKVQMMEDHVSHTLGIFQLCISETGSIEEIKKLRSTKYVGYDDKIVETMRTWRYRPYRASDGTFSRACSTVTFSYTIQTR